MNISRLPLFSSIPDKKDSGVNTTDTTSEKTKLVSQVLEEHRSNDLTSPPHLESDSKKIKPLKISPKESSDKALESDDESADFLKLFYSSVNEPLSNGQLPLHFIIHQTDKDEVDREEMIDLLIKSGADLFRKDSLGYSAFDHAAQINDQKLIAKLFKVAMEKRAHLLEKIDELTKFLDGFIDDAVVDLKNTKILLLHEMTKKDAHSFIQKIMDGENYEARMPDNKTLLHSAAASGNEEITLYLLHLGLNSDLCDAAGKNASDIAKQAGHPKIVQLIEDWKAHLKSPNTQIQAKLNNLLEFVKAYEKERLISKAGSASQKNFESDGISTHHPFLEIAIFQNNLRAFVQGVESGCPIDTIAGVRQGGNGYMDELRELKAQVLNKEIGSGSTLLHLAAYTGPISIIYYLLKKGLDPFALDKEGRTPLEIAVLKQDWVNFYLMLSFVRSEEIKEKTFNKAIEIFTTILREMDPLTITSSEITEIAFFFASLLLYLPSSFMNSWLQYSATFLSTSALFYSLFFSGFSAGSRSKPDFLHPKIRQLQLFVSKVSILEYLTTGGGPFSIGYYTIATYERMRASWESFKDCYQEMFTRPKQALFKGSVNVLTSARYLLIMWNMIAFMFPKKELVCEDHKLSEFAGDDEIKRIMSEKLNPACPGHAKIILGSENDANLKENFNRLITTYNPNKNGNLPKEFIEKVRNARETLKAPTEQVSSAWKCAQVAGKTALTAVGTLMVDWGVTKLKVDRPFWFVAQMGRIWQTFRYGF